MMVINEESKKRKRRSKNNESADKYKCGCGKFYISYPALFTHLKNKHEKRAPEGTTIPLKNKGGLRGRPKKENENDQKNNQMRKREEELKSDSELEDKTENALDEFLYFLENEEKQHKNIAFRLEKPYSALKSFPIEFFQEKDEYMPIIVHLENFEKNQQLIENVLKTEKANIDEILAIFMIKISEILKSQYYKEIVCFLCFYRKYLLEWSKKNGIKMNGKLSTAFFIEKSNEYFDNLLVKVNDEFKEKKLFFLGENRSDMKKFRSFVLHFRNWLFRCNFTNVQTEII